MEKLPPNSLEAETAVLGSVVIDPDAIFRIPFLKPEMFYNTRNGAAFAAMLNLANKRESIDIITLQDALGNDAGFLIEAMTTVPTAINIVGYAKIVIEKAERRRLIAAATKIATAAFDETKEVGTLRDEAESAIMADASTESRTTNAKQNAAVFVDDLENNKEVGIKTGFYDLDRCIGGLEPEFGYWFCAAEKMGKTSFVSGISLNIARRGSVVVRFSLEMSAKQRTRRDISVMTKIPIISLKRKTLTADERQRAYKAAGELSRLSLIIDDTPGITPGHIRSTLNRVLMQYGRVDLVEVDYWQLMNSDDPKNNRVQELEDISRGLVHVIRDFKVPLIATAQVLSKTIDNRHDKRPLLSDVHGSAALAKDAYFISFLYRDEYYNPDTTDSPGVAELIVRAHRDGGAPNIKFVFDGPTAKFYNAQKLNF